MSCAIHAQIPMDGLVGFYPFNGNTADSSGTGNHAVAGGCGYAADRFGNASSALSLDGIGDSLVIPLNGYTPMTGDFSISLWLKTSSPEAANILSLTDAPEDTVSNFNFDLAYWSPLQTIAELHYASVSYWNGSGWAGNRLSEGASGNYSDGEWKHMVIRRRDDTLQFWHDHYALAEAYYAGPVGDALPFVVGALPFRYEGLLDDIAFYDRAITDKEIWRLQHDHTPFIFRFIRSTDAYPVDDTAAIWMWTDTTQVSDSVDLDLRVNGGPWQASGHNHWVDWFPFYLPLPYSPGTLIDVRIRDQDDTTRSARTGEFTISEYTWENVSTSLPFTPRDGSGLLNHDGKMWLLGGWDPPFHEPNYTTNEVWSSTDGTNWDFITEAPWEGRHCAGWLVHDGAMWVIGADPQANAISDVWRSSDGLNWVQVLDTIPGMSPLRSNHFTASMGGEMFCMGGQPHNGSIANLSEVWSSPDGEDWSQLPDAPWGGRSMVINSCVDDDDTLWLLGGGRLNDRRCFNDVWKTGDGINWERVLEAAPWDPRYWHTVAWFDHKMWVICGIAHQTNAADVWYSSDGLDWRELKHSPFADRHAASTTVFDNSLWLMCGIISNDAWRLRNITVPLTVDAAVEPVGLPRWYPVPSDGRVRCDEHHRSAIVRNGLGQTVLTVGPGNTIDLRSLSPGIYSVRAVRANGEEWVSTVIRY
ncbi:MAG: hypothetical protein KA791_12445 [Flavobacteriales bacterium]|nr:hypothetical protein [Flavobacteriales bacterium]